MSIFTVHKCKVQCHAIDPKTAELTGAEDEGKWMPFIFQMDIITAAKMSNDEQDGPTYNCTTIFTSNGDTFIIDTPYYEFFKKFEEYNELQIIFKGEDSSEEEEGNDLDL